MTGSNAEMGRSGKWYEVLPYEEQKRKDPYTTPRGICRVCESNPVLRKDNRIREHNSAPWTRCDGSDRPSLGLPPHLRH
jgi:hypothetical protein